MDREDTIRLQILEGIKELMETAYQKNKRGEETRHQFADREFPQFKYVLSALGRFYNDSVKEILDSIDNDRLLDHLYDTYTLQEHDDEVKEDYYRECIRETVEDLYYTKLDLTWTFCEKTPDELWVFLCNVFGIGYYEKDKFIEKFDEFKDKLLNTSYAKICK